MIVAIKICSTKREPMMYSNKFIKCQFGWHAPGYCKVVDLEERMYDSFLGKVCVNCDRVLRNKTKL